MLVGRVPERRRIEELLSRARAGSSESLVVVGEPGIGKTALLEHAAASARGFEVLRARGVESEAELPFAALFELCRPLLDRLDLLEPHQAASLRAAFGMSGEQAPGSFAVGAATLSLLAVGAEQQPLLLLVDDAHWLDRGSADALAFAVRRLRADAVAALFATRAGEGRPFSDRNLPELEVEGLDDTSALTLLEGTSDAASRKAILEIAHGNPLALLELPRQGASDVDADQPLRLGKRLEHAFAARARRLSDPTQHALVVAAATSAPDLAVLQRALAQEGLTMQTLEQAERAELVTLSGATFEFRHPLVRSAVYHAADPSERRRAHAALAAALGDDERAAWHLAAAAVGPDERAAFALERLADTASRRSGMAAAAAAYERAARLTEDPDERQRRLAAAADAAWLAGRTPRARALVEEALAHAEDGSRRGRLLALLGSIEHFAGDERAASTLEEAARLLVDVDPHEACAALNLAVGSSLMKGEVDRAVAISERAFAIAGDQSDRQLFVSLSRGASLLMAGRPEEGLRFLMLSGALDEDALVADAPRELPWAALVAFWLGDAALMARMAARAVAWAREHAAVASLAFASRLLARAQLITGQWRAARASLAESLDAARISGQPRELADTLITLAWLDAAQGRAKECLVALSEATELSEQQNLQWQNGLLRAVLILELGLGLHHDDSERAARVRDAIRERPTLRDTPANATLPDAVEALIRIGDRDEAEALLEPFADEADRIGQPYPRAAVRRCRALLADDRSYSELFEEALAFHREDTNVFAEARTRLAYGERLRRSGERIAARAHLHAALAVFERLEAEPWAERARTEIRATGERLRKREDATGEELTPQELQIALVVAEGKTNREVGAQLFLSPKTVEWHLGHVYRKLGVRSRAELGRTLREKSGE